MSYWPNFNREVSLALLCIIAVLIVFTLIFSVWDLTKPSKSVKSLKLKTYSWWIILLVYILMTGINRLLLHVILALISFISFRELISVLKISFSKRKVLFWSYLVIVAQYYFSYRVNFLAFALLIPISSILLIPIRTLLDDSADNNIKTNALVSWSLILTVYSLSHIAYLTSLESIPAFQAGFQGVLLFLIFLTQVNDVFQFLSGKIFGKHFIFKKISPNKTWEGFIGGIIGTTLLSGQLSFLVPVSLSQAYFLGLIISIFGFLGDINMSAIKRDLNIKDMSDFIPGHGGILDRLDSLTFTSIVFFYCLLYWVYI